MMKIELNYQGKKNKLEIIKKANTFNPIFFYNSMFIKGENFDVMASLISGGLKEKIDLVYIDPPFNTNQNFFVNENRISTISRSLNGILAYSDQMYFDKYLEFIRERIILIHELLSEKGSLYLHIDCKVGHYIKIILDEIFGSDNFINDICRKKSNPKNFKRKAYGNQRDMLLFYVKNRNRNIWNDITTFVDEETLIKKFPKINKEGRRYNTIPIHAPGVTKNGLTGDKWKGMLPPNGRHWRVKPQELDILDNNGMIEWSKNGVPRLIKFADEHKGNKVQDTWEFIDPQYPTYPTEKNIKMIEFIIKQSSNKNSIVLDCFAGGGTTLLASINNDRKFIGIDISEISEKIIKEKLTSYDINYLNYNDLLFKNSEKLTKN